MERKNHLTAFLLFVTMLGCSSQVFAADDPSPAAADSPLAGMMFMHPRADGHGCPAVNGNDEPGLDCRSDDWGSRLAALNITAEQKAAIQQIVQSYRDRGLALVQAAARVRAQWMDVTPDDPGFTLATDEAADAAAGVAANGVRLTSSMRAEIHAILTAEQRQQLSDEIGAQRQRWADWRTRHQPAQ